MRTPGLLFAVLALGCGNKGEDHEDHAAATAEPVAPKSKGAPPKEVYKGKNRLLNLYVGKDGKTQTVDVWVRRGFKYDPVKLAEGVAFGTASAWFGVPEHMSPVVLPAGAKPDDKEIVAMAYGTADEVVTGVLAPSNGVPAVWQIYDASKQMTQAPKPPAAGKGAVVVSAIALQDYRDAMTPSFGGSSFNVGDGTGACRPQRDPAFAANALGGTSPYELDLDPGPSKITLHKWPGGSPEERCKTPAVLEFDVDVVAAKAQWVFLYSPDQGKTVKTLALPIAE